MLPGEEGAELTSLAWVTDCFDGAQRLFCARLDGQVHELCLQQLRPKASTDSYGGAVWQLAPEPAASVLLGARSARFALSTFVLQLLRCRVAAPFGSWHQSRRPL